VKKNSAILLLIIIALFLAAACGNSKEQPLINAEQNMDNDVINNIEAPLITEEELPDIEETVNKEEVNMEPEELEFTEEGSNGELAAAYLDILGGSYYLKCRIITELAGDKIETLAETAINGADIAIRTITGGIKSLIVYKDGDTYIVDYDSRLVTVMNGELAYLNESSLPISDYVFKGSGLAQLFGNPHIYERFGSLGGDVRFFFEENELIGIESWVEGLPMIREVLEISESIPQDMFDIPQDYDISYIGI